MSTIIIKIKTMVTKRPKVEEGFQIYLLYSKYDYVFEQAFSGLLTTKTSEIIFKEKWDKLLKAEFNLQEV